MHNRQEYVYALITLRRLHICCIKDKFDLISHSLIHQSAATDIGDSEWFSILNLIFRVAVPESES